MATARPLFLLACIAWLGGALAAPLRNGGDCVTDKLLSRVENVYPSVHQIQRLSIQERTTVTIAQNFDITYGNNYKVVRFVKDTTNETYLLYQCGTSPPDLTNIGLPASTKVFSVPLRAVNVEDTSALHFMKLLGIQDRVSYVTQYAVDPCMQLLGSEQCGSRISENAPMGSVDGTFSYSKDANDSISIIFTASSDLGPLHGAEYIKYIAAFFNREAVANRVFSAVYQSYYDYYAAVQAWKMDHMDAPTPVVAWLYYEQWPGSPEQIQIKFHSYRVQYTLDSGAVFFDLAALTAKYSDGDSVQINSRGDLVLYNLSTPVAITALRGILEKVDVVIDESYVQGDVSKYTVDSFLKRYHLNYSTATADLKFLRSPSGLLRLDGTASQGGYTAWFEEALARPDVVLHDFLYYMQPQVLLAANDTTPPRLVRSLIPSNQTAPALAASNGVTLLTAVNCPLQMCGVAPKPICPAVFLDCSGKLVMATEAQPCAPTNCPTLKNADGAAGHMAVAPVLLLTLLAVTMAATQLAGTWSRL